MPQPPTGRLILASASPRRQAIVRLLGLDPLVRPTGIDETVEPGERPAKAAVRLAREKALARPAADAWIVAADTIVIGPDGRLLGKPASTEEARAMLRRLRGRRHRVLTAQAVHQGSRLVTDYLSTLVTMRRYTDAEIAAYVATGDSFDKAGGYAIQHPTFRPVAALDGCYLNVVGLPICRTVRLLREAGYPDDLPAIQPPWCRFCRDAAAGAAGL